MKGQEILHHRIQAMGNNDNSRNIFSVAVMGLAGVGKSSIIGHLVKKYKSKSSKDMQRKNNEGHLINICDLFLNFSESDCILNEGTPSTDTSHIISANMFILVFAVDRIGSYEYVEQLKDIIREMKGDEAAMVVLGNKHDVSEREVGFALTDCVVSMDWGLPYVEVSMKTGYNSSLILPYLFRHESLSRYRHLFENKTQRSHSPRRKSTGSVKSDSSTSSRLGEDKPRAFSIFGGHQLRWGSRSNRNITPWDQTRQKMSLTSKRMSFVNMFMCKDTEQDATAGKGAKTHDISEDTGRRRSHSLSVIREDVCGIDTTSSFIRVPRRMSIAVHSELSDKQKDIDLVEPGRHESVLSAIRRHLKK